MARETKIGVALMVLLLGVFGGVAYKKWDTLKSAIAAKSGKTDAKAEDKPAASQSVAHADDLQPDVNPFATTESATAPPSGQNEPANPFGDAAVTGTKPFARADSAATSDTQPDATPPTQAEPRSQIQPGQIQPGQIAAASESATAAPSANDATAADDPFGDAGTNSTADATGQALADDPFGAAGEGTAAATTADTTAAPERAPPETAVVAADASDPFSGAGDAPASETPSAADPLTATPDPTFAAAGGEPRPPQPQSGPKDDPFGDAVLEADTGPANVADTAADATAVEPRPEPGVFDGAAEPIASADANPADLESQSDSAFTESAEPISEQPASAASRTDYCIVGEKDTYWSISQRVYGTSAYFQALTEYNKNRIRDPKRLRPGMTVLTPAPEELQARYPKLIAKGGSTPAEGAGRPGFLLNEAGRPAYRVGEDDTLGKIAQAHLGRASRWVQIYEMNRRLIPNPKALKPGTVLELPGDASRVRIASGK